MRYMCVNCRSIFQAPWQKLYVSLCPACKPNPERKPSPSAKRNRKRSEKAPPSTPKTEDAKG